MGWRGEPGAVRVRWVEQLDREGELGACYAGYREDGWGRAGYHPRMLVKVLLYGYCCGVTSSPRIARALENDIAFRYLSANQQPDFRTVSDFRKNHLAALQGLFVEVLRLCQAAGLAKMGRVALDGRGGLRRFGSEPGQGGDRKGGAADPGRGRAGGCGRGRAVWPGSPGRRVARRTARPGPGRAPGLIA
jgi:hypothetical protein